jgi:PAS domain S-box-containing protein
VITPDGEDWLAAIVVSSDDAVISKAADTSIRSWNAAATRMFGYTEDEVIGRSILILVPLALRAQELELLSRITRGERIDHYDTIRLKKDGTPIRVSVSISPIRDQFGTVIGASKTVRALEGSDESPSVSQSPESQPR